MYKTVLISLDTQIHLPLVQLQGNMLPLQARAFTSNIFNDSMFCSSMMSMMLILKNYHLDVSKRLSPAVLYHSNNAIAKLKQQLSRPECMHSDLVIMTIITQAVVQVSIEETIMI